MVNVCIRVDAGNKIGMGHLIESISLAESFKKNNCNIFFLTKQDPASVHVLEHHNLNFGILNELENEEAELVSLLKFVHDNSIDILICDLFGKSNSYYEHLKKFVKMLVVILDDDINREIPGDVIVNFSITQNQNFYKKLRTDTLYLIGPEYMLLPFELNTNWSEKKKIHAPCKTIFVNQGGSDPFALTEKIILSLESLPIKQKIVVVVGPAVSEDHILGLKSIIPSLKNDYQFEWGVDQDQMRNLMHESDLAITAAGNTLYELALFGVPSIVICHHERHNAVAIEFSNRGAVLNLGVGTKISESEISESLTRILSSKKERSIMSLNMKKIVDGLGSERVVEKVLEKWQRSF